MVLWLLGLPLAFVQTLNWWSILVCAVIGKHLDGLLMVLRLLVSFTVRASSTVIVADILPAYDQGMSCLEQRLLVRHSAKAVCSICCCRATFLCVCRQDYMCRCGDRESFWI